MSFNAGDPVSLRAMAQWLNSTGGGTLNTSKDVSTEECFDFADSRAYVANPLGNFDFKKPCHFKAVQGAAGGNPQVIDFDTADFGTLPTTTIHSGIGGVGVPIYKHSTSGSNITFPFTRNGSLVNPSDVLTLGLHHSIHIDVAYQLSPQYGWMTRLRAQLADRNGFSIDWSSRAIFTNLPGNAWTSTNWSIGSDRLSLTGGIPLCIFSDGVPLVRSIAGYIDIQVNCIVPDTNSNNARQASLGCPYVCWKVLIRDLYASVPLLNGTESGYNNNQQVSITAIDNINSPITITQGVAIPPFYNNYTMFCHSHIGANAKTYNPLRGSDNLPFFFEWDSSII